MTATQFDALSYEEKLLIVEPDAPKLAQFLTWYGPQRHITVYAVENFYAELIFDLTKRKVEAINAFETVDYLDQYRGFMSKLEGQIRVVKNDIHPFDQ
ncbi:hypothetical protein [Mesoflavibacter zeaxanthinifaciens]|uniref:hypothetical protein n=1 Tax=Mesoflavibacter zeaxanthinifaciens TaxID=393060 RepID=UPI003A8F958C